MTTHELARKFLTMADVPVTVRGYEGGVNIITRVGEPATLALNVNTEWYYGKHEYVTEYDKHEGREKVQAVHIG